MPCHCFGHLENIGSARMEKVEPKPQISRQLRVIPSISSDIVSPGMPVRIVSMLNITMIPESVPPVLFNLSEVVIKQQIKVSLDIQLLLSRGITSDTEIRSTASVKYVCRVHVLCSRNQARRASYQG